MKSTLEQQLVAYGRHLADLAPPVSEPEIETRVPEPRRRTLVPRFVIAVSAAALVLVAIGTVAVLLAIGGEEEPPVVTAPETATTTIAPPAALFGVRGLSASKASLWAWGEDDIWRYLEGGWSAYVDTPPSPSHGPTDLDHDGDTLWALAGFVGDQVGHTGVYYLDGGDWRELTEAPTEPLMAAADPDSAIVWLSTGDDLFRWDGEDLNSVSHPTNFSDSDWGYVGDIVATKDGSVWASGLFPWVPWNGGLARYDDVASSWETVRPLGGDEDIPAWSMVTSRDGALWVILSKWSQDWENPTAPLPEWVLAKLDSATGDWTVYDQGLPEGFPALRAADDDGVWLTSDGVGDFEPRPGIIRFNGQTWTHYLADLEVTDTIDDIAVAPDGTIWYIRNDALYQLDP